MALTDKIINIASAIRSKTNTTEYMTLDEMAINIQNIKTEPKLQDKSIEITENGTQSITADEGFDGLNSVEITTNAIEDLEQELSDYNTGLNTQEASIESITKALSSKGFYEKYAPKYLTFHQITATNLEYEVTNVDTSNVTSMRNVFYNCPNLTSLDLTNWNTSNVTDMYRVFSNCSKMTTLNLSNWDTSNVNNFEAIFYAMSSLTSLNITNWDTSKATTMREMFGLSNKLTSLDLSSFNTSNVTTMQYMFNKCSSLTSLDLSSFDTSNVKSMYQMFGNCTSLTKLDIRGFTFTKVTSYDNIFLGIPADCEIIVKGDTEKEWVKARRSDLTNVKTVAELEG